MAAKFFMRDTPHYEFEREMQTVPGFERRYQNQCINHPNKYINLLSNLIVELQLAQAQNRIANAVRTYFGEDECLFFENERHKDCFFAFRKQAEENKWPVIRKNYCVAAIYLLSAHDFFAAEMPQVIGRNRISLSKISLKNADEEIYDLYQAARFLCDGEDKLRHEDLTEPGILNDRVMALIMNAFIINKYGIRFLLPYSSKAAIVQDKMIQMNQRKEKG